MTLHDLNKLLPALDVLHRLDLEEFGHNAEYWRGRCPFHRSESIRSRSMRVNLVLRKYICHKCKKYGDLIDLAAHVWEMTTHQAALRLTDLYL